MDESRRHHRRHIARQLMQALTEGEPLEITETGEVLERHAGAHAVFHGSYRELIRQRQEEYEAIRRQRRETYPTSEAWQDHNQREHEAYQRTLEGVASALDLSFGVGENEQVAHVIYEAVMRVPDDVREFVCDRVIFLSAAWGQAFRGQDWSERWIILVAPELPAEDATGVVAHEIAHAWRGHGERVGGYSPEEEREACALARAWGFTGRGTVFESSEGDEDSQGTYIN